MDNLSDISDKTIGRPTVITEAAVAKLSEAFRLGYNDVDACQYADIDRSTFYRHTQSDPSFASHMTDAKNYARLKCSSVLLKAIEHKNIQVCQWWLERRYREQFGKSSQEISDKNQFASVFEYVRAKYSDDDISNATESKRIV